MKNATEILHDRYLKGHPLRICRVWVYKKIDALSRLWVSPDRLIFGLFGYVKIPKEAVCLSIAQENVLRLCIEVFEKDHPQPGFRKALEAQRTLTSFLRSGRLLI